MISIIIYIPWQPPLAGGILSRAGGGSEWSPGDKLSDSLHPPPSLLGYRDWDIYGTLLAPHPPKDACKINKTFMNDVTMTAYVECKVKYKRHKYKRHISYTIDIQSDTVSRHDQSFCTS